MTAGSCRRHRYPNLASAQPAPSQPHRAAPARPMCAATLPALPRLHGMLRGGCRRLPGGRRCLALQIAGAVMARPLRPSGTGGPAGWGLQPLPPPLFDARNVGGVGGGDLPPLVGSWHFGGRCGSAARGVVTKGANGELATSSSSSSRTSGGGSVGGIDASAADGGVGGAQELTAPAVARVRQSWHRSDLAAVLVMPQIPQNTGNVARTCAATAVPLHLVGPLGFQLDDRKLKRAGLDYWDAVAMSVHTSWDHFFAFFCSLPPPKRLVAFTVYGASYYAGPEFRYQPGDWLVFGAETSGLPPEAHADVAASGGSLVKIPIRDTHVRSINLAVTAGVGLFEAIRQLDEGDGHLVAPRLSPTLQEVAAAHRDGRRVASPVAEEAA